MSPKEAEALAREVLGTLGKAKEVMGGYELWRGSEDRDEHEPAPEADTLAARREVLEPWVDACWLDAWDGDLRKLEDRHECDEAFPEKLDAFAAGAAVERYAGRVIDSGGRLAEGPPLH
jgi:hypothetical protein